MSLQRSLNHIGALLCLPYVLVVFRWALSDDVVPLLSAPDGPFPICWPLLDGCAAWRPLPPLLVWTALGALAVGGILGATLFLRQRGAQGRMVLTALLVLRALIQVQDFRLSGNYHHIPQLFTAAFLWWPRPELFLRLLLVGFYVCAASLKMREDWFTGAVFYYRPDVPQGLLVAGCAAVVVLEGVLVFGLLVRRASIFWSVWGLSVLFHVLSFAFVGWFYPLEMILLLLVVAVLQRTPEAPAPFDPPGVRGWPVSSLAGVVLLGLAQTAPAAFVGDSALTGEGRLVALSMFDARAECESRARLSDPTVTLPLPAEQQVWDVRTRCDPLVHRAWIRNVCDTVLRDRPNVTLDYRLLSRRNVDPSFTRVMDVHNACAADLSYLPWRHNPWILPEAP